MAQEVTVTLAPGEEQTVSFEVNPTEIGTYNVSVDGLSGAFSVIETPMPDIRVENLSITPSVVYVGELVTISVTAKNYGTATGTKTITCIVT